MRSIANLITIAVTATLLMSCAPTHPDTALLSTAPTAAVDNDIYVADDRGRIRALRPDGSEQWIVSLPDVLTLTDASTSRDIRIDYLVARSGGKIFGLATQLTGSHMGGTILFALDSNHLVWETEVPYPEQNGGAVVVGASAIYEAAQDGAVYAFSRSDGKQIWKYQVSQGPLGSPTVSADGTIYVTGPNNNLHAITHEGKQRWVVGSQSYSPSPSPTS